VAGLMPILGWNDYYSLQCKHTTEHDTPPLLTDSDCHILQQYTFQRGTKHAMHCLQLASGVMCCSCCHLIGWLPATARRATDPARLPSLLLPCQHV
jgi:hypothetical protein